MPIYKDGNIKKDGKQKYRVRINYQDSLGKNRQITRIAYGSDEAKQLEAKLLGETREGTSPATQSMTVKQLHEEFKKMHKIEVRETTAEKSIQIIAAHILPILGDINIQKLTAPVLQDWKSQIDAKGLATNTKRNIFNQLRSILNYAVRMEYMQKNPSLRITNFNDTMDGPEEIDYYTKDEYLKFIKAAKEASERHEKNWDMFEWHYYVFFNIAFYTGLRKGEIHGLQWSDIDNNLLSVKRSVSQRLKGEDRQTPPKNKSSIRTLQIPDPLLDILDQHNEMCKKINGFNVTWKVCGGTKALRDTTVDKRNAEYAAAAGIKKIRIHDFRHSHVSLLANEGINIQEIARRLGHSKIEITWNTYSHMYPREEERAVKILNEIV